MLQVHNVDLYYGAAQALRGAIEQVDVLDGEHVQRPR